MKAILKLTKRTEAHAPNKIFQKEGFRVPNAALGLIKH